MATKCVPSAMPICFLVCFWGGGGAVVFLLGRCRVSMMQDDGQLESSSAVTEAVEEALPHLLPAKHVGVPETADEDGQAAGTPDLNPNPNPESPVGQVSSPPSSVGAPPAPTPTPNLSPREGKAADIPGAESAPAVQPGAASGTASRTICLRTLRGNKSSGAISSLAGWGGTLGASPAAPAASEQGGPPEAAAAPGEAGPAAVVAGVGGWLGVLPSSNKVVDLREVKKVKPGPLASAPAAAPVPADDSDGLEESGGPVKIDISAGKRMIEFQLKQNAAEEKREATRLKSERERAGVCVAFLSQDTGVVGTGVGGGSVGAEWSVVIPTVWGLAGFPGGVVSLSPCFTEATLGWSSTRFQ